MPLTKKGDEILESMQESYGPEKGERVFYASKAKGTITGVDAMSGSTTPAPATPAVTTTTPPVTGVNTGITPGATTAPVTGDRVVRSVHELARDAGAGDAWSPQAREAALEARRAHSGGGGGLPHNAQTLGRDLTEQEMHENIAHATAATANHPYYSANPGPEGGQFGVPHYMGTPRDSTARTVAQIARDAGAVTPMPVDPVPPIANKAMGGVPVSKDAKPMSVRSLARMAGAGR